MVSWLRKRGMHVGQRVEFRVICRYKDGTELVFKLTDTREDATKYVDNLQPRFRKRCAWLIYEATITESLKLVHETREDSD